MAVEARYVGTFGRGIWRGIDNNQIQTEPGVHGRLRCARGRTGSWPSRRAWRSARSSTRTCRAASRSPFCRRLAGAALTNANGRPVPSAERAGAARRHLHAGHRRSGASQRARGVPAEPRHLLVQRHLQWRLQRLQRAAARAPAPVPERLLRAGELHLVRHEHRFGRHRAEPLRSVHGQQPAAS